MKTRSDYGGVTALVIALTLIIIFVGVAFFAWMQIVGGGKELQHAIDAGNLNVAKQVLKSPDITLSDTVNEVAEFDGLYDSGGKVNLLNYNRLVAKAVLVALNAADMGTSEAKQHASDLAKVLEGSDGIGSRLATQLSQHEKLVGHFSLLSLSNNTRMLRAKENLRDASDETAVSFMARKKASNVFFNSSQVPDTLASFLSNGDNIVEKSANGSSKKYLTGYSKYDLGGLPLTLEGVPVRPGEQPHLVSVDDFTSNAETPLGAGSQTLVPPNSFRSGGSGKEFSSGADLRTRSCAIVGCLNMEFGASIPKGYIEIDNGANFPKIDFSGNVGGGQDIFTTVMMKPEHIDLVTNGPKGPYVGKTDALQDIISFVNAHVNDTPRPKVDQRLLDRVDKPSGLTSDDAYALANKPVHKCTNKNSISGGPGPIDQSCVDNVGLFEDMYGSTTGSKSVNGDDLMAIEAFKCFVLRERAAVGGDGCGDAVAPSLCSGLKHFNLSAAYPPGPGAPYPPFSDNAPCTISAEGSLSDLLSDSNAPDSVRRDLTLRMYQMKPDASASEIQAIFDSKVPYRKTSYICLDSSGQLVLTTSKPAVSSIDPDGNKLDFKTQEVDLNGRIVNVPGEQSYPNPWDCPPPLSGQAHNEGQWWAASGYHNLLGKLRFRNCASGGGKWCCPC